MMIVRLSGGLGNQLFQFAAAKVLEKKYGSSIVIDDSYYGQQPEKDTFRKLEIFQFDVAYARKSNASEQDNMRRKVVMLKVIDRLPVVNKAPLKLKLSRLLNIYTEDALSGNEISRDRDYIIGYFQNYQFLVKHIDIIRQEFALTADIELEMRSLPAFQHITSHTDTVAVHIRRGDYVTNANASAFHGLCGIEYYKKAIEYVSGKVSNPKFVFFSDDYEWVKESFSWVPDAYFVDNSASSFSAVDMMLMALCKHNIIANSTYSWWGAVLNSHHDNIVICPEQWTLRDSIDQLYVDGWIKL